MSTRPPRPSGCRHCGSHEHHTATHDGRRRYIAFRQIATHDALGIARSSWVVNERTRYEEAVAPARQPAEARGLTQVRGAGA
jgi:hypothetical protein